MRIILAQAKAKQGKFDAALEVLNSALESDPSNISLKLEVLKVRKDQEGIQAVLSEVTALAQDHPDNTKVLTTLTDWLIQTNQLDQAEDTAQKILKITPKQADVHLMLGRLQRKIGQLDQAISHLSDAINFDPNMVDAYIELGKTYQDRRDLEQAIKTFQKGTQVNASDPRPYYFAGMALKECKDYKNAEMMLKQAKKYAPEDANIIRQLGSCHSTEPDQQPARDEIIMSTFSDAKDTLQMIDRNQFITTLRAARACEKFQFMKQATVFWLANFPGDLYIQYLQALAYAGLDNPDQAISLLEGIIEFDPYFIDEIKALSKLPENIQLQKYYQSITEFLQGQNPNRRLETEWLNILYNARQAFYQSDFDKALAYVHQSLVLEPPSAIPNIFHLQIVQKMENLEILNNISDIHHAIWPKCLQVNIIKAIADIDIGQTATGVERLHWVAAYDSAGQAIERLLGGEHRFKDLWPENFEVYFDLPIPASVNGYLGWNQLYSGLANELREKQPQKSMKFMSSSSDEVTRKLRVSSTTPKNNRAVEPPKKTDKEIEEVQKAFSKLAKRVKAPELVRADNRFPTYVIMSAKRQLEKVYGPKTAGVIDDLLHRFANLVQNLEDWSSVVFYPDDVTELSDLALKPVLATDAWQVKLALNDLDKGLAKRGEMIGALLIIGGPEIIPYHNLPNPTDDNDREVPSDNPYSTIDENYFIPQWPVGRLPGETGPDSGLLLSQLRQLIQRYETGVYKSKKSIANLHSIIDIIVNFLLNLGRTSNNSLGLGYAAEIWRKSSALVYKNAGNSRDLQLSPPINSSSLSIKKKPGHNIGYFNLHGVKDGPNWYGQKDFSSTSSGPDYPIALTPGMFNEQTPAPQLTFTEACYGANILDKHHEEALALNSWIQGRKHLSVQPVFPMVPSRHPCFCRLPGRKILAKCIFR